MLHHQSLVGLRSGAVLFKHLLGEGDILLLGLVLGHPFLRVPGVPFGLALRIQLPVRYRSMEGNILDNL